MRDPSSYLPSSHLLRPPIIALILNLLARGVIGPGQHRWDGDDLSQKLEAGWVEFRPLEKPYP